MTEEQQAAIVDFALGRRSREALEAQLGFKLDDGPAVFGLLKRAISSRDHSHVQCALMLAFRAWGLRLDAPEGIDVVAVDALFDTALTKFAYLEHDNSYPLARKCTWALADIGTPQAREKLRILAGNDDAEIAGYAQRRLDRWDTELSRKGPRKQ